MWGKDQLAPLVTSLSGTVKAGVGGGRYEKKNQVTLP